MSAGKGDTPRKVDQKKWAENYDRIFKKDSTRFCSKCGADWQGKPIPEADQHHFGGKKHFSRLIGIYSQELDRTVYYQCPDCGSEITRK